VSFEFIMQDEGIQSAEIIGGDVLDILLGSRGRDRVGGLGLVVSDRTEQ